MKLARHGASRLWKPGDPRLAHDPDRARAAKTLLDYIPVDDDQAHFRVRMIAFLHQHERALSHSCLEGHLTSSVLVIDFAGERALLTLHARLGRWLQLGGHLDGDGNLAGSALREAIEESGIDDLHIDPRPIDLDVHEIPAHGDEPEHLHLDTRFLVYAPEGASPEKSVESLELGWFSPDELAAIPTDGSLRRLFQLAFD